MDVVSFFKGIGHQLARAFGLIKKLVPEEQLAKGIELAREAAEKFVDKPTRREWVVGELMHIFHVPESIARLIVEIAVQHLKADAIDKAAAKATAAVGS